MKFGFKPELQQMQKILYTNINSFTKILMKNINFIKKIKIEEVRKYCLNIINLIFTIYTNQDFDKVELFTQEPGKYNRIILMKEKSTKMTKLTEKLNHMIEILDILPKKGLLWSWLKKSFYKECKNYSLFMDLMVNSKYNVIEYRNKIYKNPYKEPFQLLSSYVRNKFVIDLSDKYN